MHMNHKHRHLPWLCDVIRQHYCLHSAICKISLFKLLFCINTNVHLCSNDTCILPRPNSVHRYVYVIYVAVFGTLTVTKHFQQGEEPPKSLGGSMSPPNMWMIGSPKSSSKTTCQSGQLLFCSSPYSLPILYNRAGCVP